VAIIILISVIGVICNAGWWESKGGVRVPERKERSDREEYLKAKQEYELYRTGRIKKLLREYYNHLLGWSRYDKYRGPPETT